MSTLKFSSWQDLNGNEVANSSYPPGLVLVKTQTIGSGVSSVTVTDAFSSTFANYRIVGFVNSHSGAYTAEMRLGVGATMTTTGYYWGHVNVTTGGTVIGVGNANDLKFGEISVATSNGWSFCIDVMTPNQIRRTSITSAGSDMRTAGNPLRYMGGYADNTTQFTSFLVKGAGGTMSGGEIRVYGYNNG